MRRLFAIALFAMLTIVVAPAAEARGHGGYHGYRSHHGYSRHAYHTYGAHRGYSRHAYHSYGTRHGYSRHAYHAYGAHRVYPRYAYHHSRILRSAKARREFEAMTGYPHGRPGYVIDHITPLACGGADNPSNMQWQTIAQGKAKDKWERKSCSRHR